MARMEADLIIDAGRAVVTLGGALDSSNAHRLGALMRRLISEGCTEIVADLSSVSRLDAAAIGILRGAAKAVARGECDGALRCFGASGQVAAALTENGIRIADDLGEVRGDGATTAAPPAGSSQKATREPHTRARSQGRTTSRSRVGRT